VTERIDSTKVRLHGGMRAMLELQKAVVGSGLEPSLLQLVEIRASQINGCAFCIDMHTKEARARGESEQRIYALDAWREAPWFSPRERAPLAWTEAVTLVADTRVPDAVYDETRAQLDEKEIVALTFAINGWNRLSVSFRRAPGDPRVAHVPVPTAVPA
jgi:AhpD family alkylhydroperoxidase